MDASLIMLDIVRGPIILADPTMPVEQRYKGLLLQARMKAYTNKECAFTYPEVALYLSSAALMAPLDGDWTDIFAHVTCTVEKEYFGRDMFEQIGAPKELSSYRLTEIRSLQNRLYEKRIAALKKKL